MAEKYLGESLPKLGFGFMRVPIIPKKGTDWTTGTVEFDEKKIIEMVDYYMESGYNVFHTAWAYEGNEACLGRTLVARYPRDKFVIVDNLPVHVIDDPAQVVPMFEETLKNLQTDYVDYLFLHMLNPFLSERCEKTGVWDFIKRMKEEGKAKHIGFSFHSTAKDLDDILTKHPEVEAVQLQINYFDWISDTPDGKGCYDVAWGKHHKSIFVMEPVKGGILGADVPAMNDVFKKIHPEDSNASWAIRWILQLEGLATAFSGMSSLEQVKDNVRVANEKRPLTEVELKAYDEVIANLKKNEAYPCTHCRYCIPLCPMHISCCDMIDCVNDWVTYKLMGKAKHHYDFITGHEIGAGKPATCVECGACEGHCPQHLPIMKIMKEAAEIFDDPDLVVDQY
jgi:predicted aldo/keto reductase-like oxidoreductase